MKRIIVFVAPLVLFFLISCNVYANEESGSQDEILWGETGNVHGYRVFNDVGFTDMSFLVPTDQGYMRVQAGVGYGEDYDGDEDERLQFAVEYYDQNFNRTSLRFINMDLPIWGGFCTDGEYYYVTTGQSNPNESDDLEVIRVSKYDKQWNRIQYVSIKGAGIRIPFHSGTCSMAIKGSVLAVHTCRTEYKDSIGKSHQTNYTFTVKTTTMKILEKVDECIHNDSGFVSHSFGQIVQFDGNRIVTVDHGDGGPRAIVLKRFRNGSATSGEFIENELNSIDVLEFDGNSGENYTGAFLGDLQITNDTYLITGSSIPQEYFYDDCNIRNVFLGVVYKSGLTTELKWITNYKRKGIISASNPYLIRVDDDSFLLMWDEVRDDDEDNRQLKCIFVDAQGETTSAVQSVDAYLTDCRPILNDGKIVWYSWDNGETIFYQMPVDNPTGLTKTVNSYKKDPELYIKTTTRTIKAKKLKKKARVVQPFVYAESDNEDADIIFQGTGVNAKSRKALKINKYTGKVTVKKKTKKGKYSMKVTVTVPSTSAYNMASKTVTITVQVK